MKGHVYSDFFVEQAALGYHAAQNNDDKIILSE